MKKYKIILHITFFSLISINLQAAPIGWTANSEITNISITGNGSVNIKLNPILSGCTPQAGYNSSFVSVLSTHPGIKLMHANLMTAFSIGKKVRLYLSDSSCNVTEMQLENI